MIYILTAVFVLYLYIIINEVRLKVSFDNIRDYILKGMIARNAIENQMTLLRDQVREMDDVVLKHTLRIESLEEPKIRRRAKARVPMNGKLPKNFGIVKAETNQSPSGLPPKAEALRIKRRDAMRRYRAKKRGTKTK